MRKISLGTSGLQVPVIAVGCMRINGLSAKEAEAFVKSALEQGVNFFEHADIYGDTACEEIFARAAGATAAGMTAATRERFILQSKCGIISGKYYDFSKAHILQSVDGSLRRLGTDYLDVLLLHRPDMLVEPAEVAAAFDILHNSGKVRHFGVSNQNPAQIELLKKHVRQPLVANQLQLSIANAGMIGAGIHVNMADSAAVNRDGSILDYCRLHDITIQTWSPFQYGFFEGVFIGSPKFPALNAKLDELAAKYGVTSTTIAAAWILRHPANFQLVSGTMNSARLREITAAANITLSRPEWYEIYLSAGNTLP
jgi:predicted oxidoreductase